VTPRVLILGGTAEARRLAAELDEAGVAVTSSLAGRVSNPHLPLGAVRIGGFGGPAGLAGWVAANAITAVVDATHPFAERISASAALAAASTGVPLLRLERPGWRAADGDRWTWVDDLPGAAAALGALGARRVLLTTGRQGLSAFAGDTERWFLVRCVDPPDVPLPRHHRVLLARGPYTLHGELALIDDATIDIVVTKDSGGEHTAAKLRAARMRHLPVVVVRRPARPARAAGAMCATCATVSDAVAWVHRAANLLVAEPDAADRGSGDPHGRAERHQVAELEHRGVLDADAAV
jgi:precorrin-6A/cobalt-precorrin-6A reductase